MTKVEIKPSQHVMILGKTGSGKSVFQHKIFIPALLKQKNSVLVILDGKNEYTDFKTTVTEPQELNELLYESKKRPKVIRVVVTEPTEEICEEFLRASWSSWNPRNSKRRPFAVRFFIEDMPIYYNSPYATPYWLMKWVSFGRAYHRTIVGTTQRAQMIPKTPLQMVEHLFVFRISEYDRKMVIKQYYDTKSSSAVASLPQYSYLLISDLYEQPIMFKPYSGKVKSPEKGVDV